MSVNIPRTTPPAALVQQLAALASEQSRRPEVRELAQHVRNVTQGNANAMAVALLSSVAIAGVRRPAFNDAVQAVDNDVMHVLEHGSDCSGLAIALCALYVAAGLPSRITWTPGRAQETGLAHVFAEVEIGGQWRPADATDPRVARKPRT